MAWISVDELLEKIILKLYKQWERRLLSQVRPLLDDERLRLANALRAMALAQPAQCEDAIILFLERLGTLEAVMAAAPEEFVMLPEIKQQTLRARKPGIRFGAPKVRTNTLNPARMQTILAMLEAIDPPAYAVTRMFLPEDLVALATLFEAVLLQVFTKWEQLALETRGAILRVLKQVRNQLSTEDGHSFVTVRSVVETLHQFESMPEVMQVSRDAFLAGKLDNPVETPFRFNEMVPVSERLAKMISSPPPVSPSAAPADGTLPEGVVAPDGVGELPSGEPPNAEAAPDAGPVAPVGPSLSLFTPPPKNEVVERDFYADVRFPQQVRAGEKVALEVRLKRSPFDLARTDGKAKVAFGQTDQPEYVEVIALAQGFGEATGSWSRTMAVFVDRESRPAIFLLQAQAEKGEKRVTLDFIHKGRHLGSVGFVTRIVEQPPQAVGGVVVDKPALTLRFVEQPPPPADLELRIVRGHQDNVLNFMLHSTRAGVGYDWKPVGQIQLKSSSPQSYLQGVFANLGGLEAQTADALGEEDSRVSSSEIAAIGQQLFKELFPPELQQELWTRILPKRRDANNPDGIISTLLITSDEPWIPWELVKPVRVNPETGAEQSAGYLAEMFQVSRWLAGRSPAHQIHIRRATLVAPQSDLPHAQREEAYFRRFPTRQVDVMGPLRSTADVRAVAQAGGAQLLHVAAYGRFDPENANLSPLSLEDGALTPFDLVGERAEALRREQPMVFINTGHTARLAFTLTGLGGWVERLISDLHASALIGTLWEVNDLLATEFAFAFYDRLLAGDTLGQAFYAARMHVRDRQPGNPTWLAYVLYADPNSFVLWGADEEDSEQFEPEVEEIPVEPPKPEIDPAELKAALATILGGSLADLLRGSMDDMVERAVARALGDDSANESLDDGENGDEPTVEPFEAERHDVEADASDAAEGNEGETRDAADSEAQRASMLGYLSALASAEGDPGTTGGKTPNGVHPHENVPPPAGEPPSPDPREQGEAPRRPRSSRRRADDSDSSTGGPRSQA